VLVHYLCISLLDLYDSFTCDEIKQSFLTCVSSMLTCIVLLFVQTGVSSSASSSKLVSSVDGACIYTASVAILHMNITQSSTMYSTRLLHLHHRETIVIVQTSITMPFFMHSPVPNPRLTFLLLLLLPQRPTRRPLEFSRILPRHARFVASAFATFPEPVAFFADEPLVAEAAVFGAVVLFAGTWELLLVN